MPRIAPETTEFDVIIVGAGLSGINTAYAVQTKAPPGTTYAVLEGRNHLGGTWDLFRYPGIRTDSDVHSYGFPWNPVGIDEQLATGDEILSYMRKSAALYGIDDRILYNHRVLSMDWISSSSNWSLAVVTDGQVKTYSAKFVVLGTGYYDYNTPLEAKIPGLDSFAGPVVHPQFWPSTLDYSKKHVVVIGSGATAITLVPSLAGHAKRVTMLQRSPSYIMSILSKDKTGIFLRKLLPPSWASWINRMRWIISSYLLYYFCILFPQQARSFLTKAAKKQLPPSIPMNPHFDPSYDPWQQRVCFCPDGDFYKSLRCGKADVVTGTIREVTASTIELESGERLKPDIIITATGLKIKVGGSIRISIDSEIVDPSQKFAWRGSMLQDVPNLAVVLGYFNASFTLGAEVTAQLVVRLLRKMSEKQSSVVIPRMQAPKLMQEQPVSPLNATYIKAAQSEFPKAGQGVWAPRTNYFKDIWTAQWGNLEGGLEFLN